jgi:hypothetical protein
VAQTSQDHQVNNNLLTKEDYKHSGIKLVNLTRQEEIDEKDPDKKVNII